MMSYRVALYANSRPRLATYLPLARAIRSAGHSCDLYCSPSCAATDQEREGYLDIPLNFVQAREVPNLSGYDLFVSSEKAHDLIPPRTRAVAILHSLPDRDILRTGYANWLKSHPYISRFDYFFVAVRQNSSQWRAENYKDTGSILAPASELPGDFVVVPGGYPELEYLAAILSQRGERDCILYCPTKSDNSASEVRMHGAEIIRRVHERFPDHYVVFRPYPVDDREVIQKICDEVSELPRVIVDRSVTGIEFQRRGRTMITDRSSVAISFSLASLQPSIFFSAGKDGVTDALKEEIIGFDAAGWSSLQAALDQCVHERNGWPEKLQSTLDQYLYNPLSAASYLAGNVPAFAKGETHPDWLIVPR